MTARKLKDYEGVRRVLLLFGPEETHPHYIDAEEQVAASADHLETLEITVLSIYGSGSVFEGTHRLKDQDAAVFRQQFGAHRNEFTGILLDYDGEVVARHAKQLDLPSMLADLRGRMRTQHAPPQRESQPHAKGSRAGRHQADEPPR